MPDNCENKDADWLKVTNLIDYVNQLSDEYNSALHEETLTRGLTNKLCNESNLKINLPKFRGYDSPLDIYSFQAEFEKLISPTVKVNLIPDYLKKKNFLEGTALLVVKGIDNLEDIWQRLKNAYGNTENLLKIKLKDIRKDGPIWKIKDTERFVTSLSKLIYALVELQKLAFKHNIENELYYGGSIETIYEIIGFKYRNKLIEKYCQTKLSKKEIWDKMIHYLKDKLVVMEQIVLIDQSKSTYNPKMKLEEEKHYKDDSKRLYHSFVDSDKELKCHLCDRSDHVSTLDFRGKNVIEYYACEKIVNMTPKQRFELLKEKGLCRQCLNPGVNSHKHEKNNLILLDEYKRINMSKDKLVLPEYSKNIRIGFHNLNAKEYEKSLSNEDSVFLLQTIQVENKKFNLFYDSGCQDLVSKKEAIDKLEVIGRASSQLPGPITLFGVGNQKSESTHGIYSVRLPLFDGRDAVMSGICLDIPQNFPFTH